MVDRIIIDPVGGAEGQSAIGAASEHHVAPVGGAERFHCSDHVNVVVRGAAGAVNSQKNLSYKSARINRAAVDQTAAHVNCGNLFIGGADSGRRFWCICSREASKPCGPSASRSVTSTTKSR